MAEVLFVCTGNTCRSPLAEALFNDICARGGLPYRAESAGLYAREGEPASQNTYLVGKERGLNLSMHVSRPLSAAAIREARLVVTMGEDAAGAVRMRYPGARVVAFRPPIQDPYGGSLDIYRATAAELEKRMPWVLQQLSD
jgi:protein-tyrosine-phosphatase